MENYSLNLMDVDFLVQSFLQERSQGIETLHNIYLKNNSNLSLRALKEDVLDELRTGCVSFINKQNSIDELNNYLFYIVNAFCKKLAIFAIPKYKTEYICPGCLYLKKDFTPLSFDKVFKCEECKEELNNSSDVKKIHFFSTFAVHNKQGRRCPDCERFIPYPIDNSSNASCPYFDCCFSGSINDLAKMHHPTSKSNPEKLILDNNNDFSLKNNIVSSEVNADTKLEIEETLLSKIKIIQDIIQAQYASVAYGSSDATIKHKQFVYQAFSNLLKTYPSEMSAYLLNDSHSNMGFQHKVFQEYIRLLESSFPFIITKNKKLIKIDNLLDKHLCIFDGISEFDGMINEKLIIKNNTKEFYIGGRKATYAKPYYIGKLLNVVNYDTKQSLIANVVDYSFLKITMVNIKINTPVVVTHLRIPPHYGMGGMTHVNRIRKKIVERTTSMECK